MLFNGSIYEELQCGRVPHPQLLGLTEVTELAGSPETARAG